MSKVVERKFGLWLLKHVPLDTFYLGEDNSQHLHGLVTYYSHYDPSKFYFPTKPNKLHPLSADAVLYNAYGQTLDYRLQYKAFDTNILLLPKHFSYKLQEWCTRYEGYADEICLSVRTKEQYTIYSQFLREFLSLPPTPR